MFSFFKGAFGIADGETAQTPLAARRAADLRDNILDQLVTLTWTAVLLGQEWTLWRLGLDPDPWPVTGMAAMALGYAAWRLTRLVPRWRAAAAG